MTHLQHEWIITKYYFIYGIKENFDYELNEILKGYEKLIFQGKDFSTIYHFLNTDPDLFFEILMILNGGYDWKSLDFFLEFEAFRNFSLWDLVDNEIKIKEFLLIYSPELITSVFFLADSDVGESVYLLREHPNVYKLLFYLKKYGVYKISYVWRVHKKPLDEILNGKWDQLL